VEEIEKNGRIGLWGVNFSYNTKLYSFGGTKKLYQSKVLEGLYEFFKLNLCCYIIFKIKNIVIICINVSFSKKLLLNFLKDFSIFPHIFHPQSLLFHPLQTRKQSLKEEKNEKCIRRSYRLRDICVTICGSDGSDS